MLFDPSPPAWVNDWDTELETNFGPFNPVGEAKAKIETLVMLEGSHSQLTLWRLLNCLVSHIQWDDHALLQQAYKGLARHIKNEMVHHDQPITLLDLQKLIQAIDHRY